MPKHPAEPPRAEHEAPAEETPGQELQRLFGANFRKARQKAKLSQSEVGKLTDMQREMVSAIESGKHNLTLKTMDKLARAVDHGVTTLLGEASAPSSKK